MMLPRLSSAISKSLVRYSTKTIPQSRAALCVGGNALEVTGLAGTVKYNKKWLRDHCRGEGRYHWDSRQRALDIPDVGLGNDIVAAQVQEEELLIQWADGINSKYRLNWLEQNYNREVNPASIVKWDGEIMADSMENIKVNWNEYMETDEGVRKLVEAIVRYGVGLVEGAPVCIEKGTRATVERLAPILRNVYGDVWVISPDLDHEGDSDSSYTNLRLESHTDGTYMSEAPGIQTFHILKEALQGGETVITDGINIADKFRSKHPEYFSFLASHPIPSEYIHLPQQYSYNVDTVFKLDPVTLEFLQFRYNVYDRAPLNTISHHLLDTFYDALTQLSLEVKDPKNEMWFKLMPGTVMFTDNWRVTHGRAGFAGSRTLSGCYMARTDFRSRAKAFGLI